MADAARYSTPGAGLRHRQVQHLAVQRLDVQRISPEKPPGQRGVQMRFDRTGAVERLAEPDHAGIGVDADPEDVGELLRPQRLESDDLHGATGGSKAWIGGRLPVNGSASTAVS